MAIVAQFASKGVGWEQGVPEVKAFRSWKDLENYMSNMGYALHAKDLHGREYYEDAVSDERAYVYDLAEMSVPSKDDAANW